MVSIISVSDQQLLSQHHVKISVDLKQHCGTITLANRSLSVSLMSRIQGKSTSWNPLKLDENAMKETTRKVAVMLLKKELLQKSKEPLNFKINQTGIAHTSRRKFVKHEDKDKKKDTSKDFNDLRAYLVPFILENETFVPYHDDLSDLNPTPAAVPAQVKSKPAGWEEEILDEEDLYPRASPLAAQAQDIRTLPQKDDKSKKKKGLEKSSPVLNKKDKRVVIDVASKGKVKKKDKKGNKMMKSSKGKAHDKKLKKGKSPAEPALQEEHLDLFA